MSWFMLPDGPFNVVPDVPAITAASAPDADAAPPSRSALLAAAVAAEEEKYKNVSAVAKTKRVAAANATVDGRSGRDHEDEKQKYKRLTSPQYANAALAGQRLIARGGGWQELDHPFPCPNALPAASPGSTQLPCYHNLWEGGDADLRQHIRTMANKTRELRTQYVFERMRNAYYAAPGSDGLATGKPRWHYRVNGREVCLPQCAHVYMLPSRTCPLLLAGVRTYIRCCPLCRRVHLGGAAATRQD